MGKIGFDNQKYIETQSARIRERIGQFGGKESANGVSLTVTNCVNNGTVTGVQQTGGLVGYGFFNTSGFACFCFTDFFIFYLQEMFFAV